MEGVTCPPSAIIFPHFPTARGSSTALNRQSTALTVPPGRQFSRSIVAFSAGRIPWPPRQSTRFASRGGRRTLPSPPPRPKRWPSRASLRPGWRRSATTSGPIPTSPRPTAAWSRCATPGAAGKPWSGSSSSARGAGSCTRRGCPRSAPSSRRESELRGRESGAAVQGTPIASERHSESL